VKFGQAVNLEALDRAKGAMAATLEGGGGGGGGEGPRGLAALNGALAAASRLIDSLFTMKKPRT
jgi:hypothetical protein